MIFKQNIKLVATVAIFTLGMSTGVVNAEDADRHHNISLEVMITNTSQNQIFTPIIAASHKRGGQTI